MADTGIDASYTPDEVLAIGWGAGASLIEIAAYLNVPLSILAMRRYQLRLPDRDHKKRLLSTLTHPFDWVGVNAEQLDLPNTTAGRTQ